LKVTQRKTVILFYGNQSLALKEETLNVLRKKNEQNIQKNNFPPSLKAQYDGGCEKLPVFGQVLDDLHEKRDCLKDFSDPGFFFESWAVAEMEKQEKKKRDRKAKKKKKC